MSTQSEAPVDDCRATGSFNYSIPIDDSLHIYRVSLFHLAKTCRL